jgi:aminoglycoside phosphotransferase (APT) family kinase protein
MQHNDTPFHMFNERLPLIWEAHGLGSIRTITWPARGSINYCLIVNNAYVIRFDITGKTVSRFQSEALAYHHLCASGVPVPRVVALDQSKELVPYEYLITTRLEGTPVIDGWSDLSVQERERIAYEAGRYLAVIYSHTFDRFGYKLYNYLEFLVDSKRRADETQFHQMYAKLHAALQAL